MTRTLLNLTWPPICLCCRSFIAGEDEFDVIHFHVDLIHFPFFEELAHKTVTTLHGRLDLKDLSEAYARWPQYPLVSISNDQRRPLPVVSQFEIRRP